MKKTEKREKPMTKAQEKKMLKRAVNKAFDLWGEIGSLYSDFRCEYCGIAKGEIKGNGKPTVLNHHHLIVRENHGLRFNPRNCITLDQWCHKFGREGAHRGTLIFNEWFRMNQYRGNDYYYLIDHKDDSPIESLEDVALAVAQLYAERARLIVARLENEHTIAE